MSSAKEIFETYNAMVPFPITPAKIRAAGYDVGQYLNDLIDALGEAEDSHDPRVQKVLRKVRQIRTNYKKT